MASGKQVLLSWCSTVLGSSFFQGQNKLIKLFTALVIKPCCLGCIILGVNLPRGKLRLHNVACPSRGEGSEDSLCSSAGRCSVPASPARPQPNFSAKGHFPWSGAYAASPERSPPKTAGGKTSCLERESWKTSWVYLDTTLLPKEKENLFQCGALLRALCRRCAELHALSERRKHKSGTNAALERGSPEEVVFCSVLLLLLSGAASFPMRCRPRPSPALPLTFQILTRSARNAGGRPAAAIHFQLGIWAATCREKRTKRKEKRGGGAKKTTCQLPRLRAGGRSKSTALRKA